MQSNRARRDDDLNAETARDAARQYLERGWKPLPIPHGQKNPTTAGWPEWEITPENVDDHFAPSRQNIGLQLGRASNGLTDVDLDCNEAIALAPYFLPSTDAMFGRRSKRRAHWLYETDLYETEHGAAIQYREPNSPGGAMLLELRIGAGDKGAQTLAPPSTHPSGETVEWDKVGEPKQIKGGSLKKKVARLAAATLLMRHYPGEGSRHQCALVLGGVLARAGWSEDTIGNFVEAITRCAGDEEYADRVQAARSAVAAMQRNVPVPGLQRMREEWGPDVTDIFARWLNLYERSLPADAPLKCARAFAEDLVRDGGVGRLVHHRGTFYQYTGTHYETTERDDLESKLYEFLDAATTVRRDKTVPFNPNSGKVRQILNALQAGVHEEERREAPFWLDRPDRDAASNVACRNGLLDISTRELVPHTSNFFNVNCLTFDYDPEAPPPRKWGEFLQQLWPGDEGKCARLTLLEMLGLMLTPDTSFQKVFMVVGPKRSGKGTIIRVSTALLGKDNVATPKLHDLTQDFRLAPLIDKRVACITDARIGSRTDGHAVAERLLSISGEDEQQIDRKYRPPWQGKLHVRFLISTNELPRVPDASGALASRFVLLTLRNSFLGREDLQLTEKLLTELPGILNAALRGLDRLRDRGHFRIPQSSLDAIQQLEDLASPIGAFLRDWCVLDPREQIAVRAFYEGWQLWCERNGHRPRSQAEFGKDLVAAAPDVRVRGRNPERFYQGVGWSTAGARECQRARRASTRHS